jgi:hypothetical protein
MADEVRFEASAVQRRSARPPLGLLGWAALLLTIAVAGTVGRRIEATTVRAEANASPIASGDQGRRAGRQETQVPGPIALERLDVLPVRTDELPLAARISVEGRTLVRAAVVDISIETLGDRVVQETSFRLPVASGEFRPVRQARWSAEFGLPRFRPVVPLWLVVIAYDAKGLAVGSLRVPLTYGTSVPFRLRHTLPHA